MQRISRVQKKKLVEFMLGHPELKKMNVMHNYKDAEIIWQQLSNECNSLPGARRTWKQWRTTWYSLCTKAKVRKAKSIGVRTSEVALSKEDIAGLNSKEQTTLEFVNLEQHRTIEDLYIEDDSTNKSLSEPESKVVTRSQKTINNSTNERKERTKHSEDCLFNCDLIAVNEKRNLNTKEDYYNLKRDYLKQKLKMYKEQTEALRKIASALSDD